MAWFVALILLIAAELVVLVEVARAIGVLPAVALVVLISASGPWLVRRAGLGVWRRVQERVAAGRSPGPEALSGAALLAGGVLVCIPGFITDVVGLTLLLPPVRRLAGRLLLRHFTRRAPRRGGRSGGVIDAEAVDGDGHPRPPGGGFLGPPR